MKKMWVMTSSEVAGLLSMVPLGPELRCGVRFKPVTDRRSGLGGSAFRESQIADFRLQRGALQVRWGNR